VKGFGCSTSPLRRASAELIGTYALVTAGCGAIVIDSATGALTHVGVALTFGLIITVMIAATGHLSFVKRFYQSLT
jgi:aquaporin NIP